MIVSEAVIVPTLILDLTMALTIGFALGCGVREWISRRRRQAERRRQGLGGVPGMGTVLSAWICPRVRPVPMLVSPLLVADMRTRDWVSLT